MRMVRHCIAEALRLYPAPPILIRRCLEDHKVMAAGFPDGISITPGQDVMISTWSIHRDPRLWGEDAAQFDPTRFDRPFIGTDDYQKAGGAGFNPQQIRDLYPDETASDFAFLPFGGGNRKCVGDQFAMLESTVLLAKALREFHYELQTPITLGMGATIFSKTGLQMKPTERSTEEQAASAAPYAPSASSKPTTTSAGQCPAHQ